MTHLFRPDNGQMARFVTCEREFVCLRLEDTITPAVRWFKLADVIKHNSSFAVQDAKPETVPPMEYTCEPPPRAIVLWRPTIELPIWELGYFREGSKEKAVPGVNLLTSNMRIVLTLPAMRAA